MSSTPFVRRGSWKPRLLLVVLLLVVLLLVVLPVLLLFFLTFIGVVVLVVGVFLFFHSWYLGQLCVIASGDGQCPDDEESGTKEQCCTRCDGVFLS